ncbi:MAG: hypothetical protein JWQ96_1551 [Segetibacter sp.]|nr:hypothetical protein [Segetibacter sp.]
MEATDKQIETIYEKLQTLIKQHQKALKEVERLQKENDQLKAEMSSRSDVNKELVKKVDSLKLNALNLHDHARKDLEKRINTYLNEIDKCLSLLNS